MSAEFSYVCFYISYIFLLCNFKAKPFQNDTLCFSVSISKSQSCTKQNFTGFFTTKPSVSLSSHIEVTFLIKETDARDKNVQNFY